MTLSLTDNTLNFQQSSICNRSSKYEKYNTVRMADRIIVLSEGKILEIGSHAELMQLDGTYTRLFNLQAEGYR